MHNLIEFLRQVFWQPSALKPLIEEHGPAFWRWMLLIKCFPVTRTNSRLNLKKLLQRRAFGVKSFTQAAVGFILFRYGGEIDYSPCVALAFCLCCEQAPAKVVFMPARVYQQHAAAWRQARVKR